MKKRSSGYTTKLGEKIEVIIEMYNKGYSAGQIADKYGVSPQGIHYHLKKNGVKTRATSEYFSPKKGR